MFLNVIFYSSGTIISTSTEGIIQPEFCGSIFTILKIVKCYQTNAKGSPLFLSGYTVKFSNDEYCTKLVDIDNKYILALSKQLEELLIKNKIEL